MNLTQAAAHDVGHSLGSTAPQQGSRCPHGSGLSLLQDFDLCPDDIERVQALCGKPNPESNEVVEKKEKWIPGNSIESRIAFWGEYGKQKLKEIKLQY